MSNEQPLPGDSIPEPRGENAPSIGENTSEGQKRPRRRRKKSSRPQGDRQQRPGHHGNEHRPSNSSQRRAAAPVEDDIDDQAEFDSDLDSIIDDDEDDLSLPSYGMKFDRSGLKASEEKRKDAKKTPAPAAKPPALRPAQQRPPQRPASNRPPAQRPPSQSSQRQGQRERKPAAGDQQGGVEGRHAAPQRSKQPPKRSIAPPSQSDERRPESSQKSDQRTDKPAVTSKTPTKPPRRSVSSASTPSNENDQQPPATERRSSSSQKRAPERRRPPTASREPVRSEVPSTDDRGFHDFDDFDDQPMIDTGKPLLPKGAHSAAFAALGLSEGMLDSLAAAGYEEPTPVQAGVIPRALTGADVMGQAQTGTGKTAAFAIPILERMQPPRRGAPPQAMVLVPTRELAVQVRDEFAKLAQGRNIQIVAVYGGKPIRQQIDHLSRGAAVIVGTPGRVLDLMSRGALSLGQLQIAVLDEADRMLDIGFRPDIEKILRRCPATRQTLLLTATLAPPVKRLAERYMNAPEALDFSPKNVSVDLIEQFYFTVDPQVKFDLLVKLMEREDPKQAIIFCRTKRGTDKVQSRLGRRFAGMVDTIHGDLQQNARDRVMKAFREGRVRWLVATDVVGRGIDVSGISHIINYDLPQFCDDYVHRVGRTGRMGREGVAYSFVTPEEGAELTRIEIRINRLLKRDEIEGFSTCGGRPEGSSDTLPPPSEVDGSAQLGDEKKAVPVFGKPIRRVRRAL